MSLKTQYVWKNLLRCQIHLYWKEIEERINLINPQKRQSESFVLIYEWLKVIILICLPIHIQNTNSNRNNNEKQLLWYKK